MKLQPSLLGTGMKRPGGRGGPVERKPVNGCERLSRPQACEQWMDGDPTSFSKSVLSPTSLFDACALMALGPIRASLSSYTPPWSRGDSSYM